uniref:HNH domain-containing protein n=1 Tax=Eutreptiella gymnastica TaxID=73025 RepID=A0A7S4C8S4_9EUGL
MQKAFPCLLADSLEVDLIRESVTEELLDSVPQSTQAMQDRLEDLLLGQEDFGVEQEEFSRFYELLTREMELLMQEDDDDDDLEPGCCAMCERPMPLTFHHLIPKQTHSDLLKKGTFSKDKICRGIWICRPCHSAIHSLHDNKTLAAQYNTLEALLELEQIQRFIKWVSKQRVRSKKDGQLHYRR